MNDKKTTNCGAIEMLHQLRQSQSHEVQNEESKHYSSSRLDKYISESKNAKKSKQTEDTKSKDNPLSQETDSISLTIYEIDPYIIHKWSGKDRPENELGDIEDLAKGFKDIGQQVPCIVRPHSEFNGEYELIVGECRWHAAKLAKMNLKVIIQQIDDRKAALIQAAENEKRNDLSEYAKGMSYAKKINDGILKQKDLTDILGISRQQVSRLLSFSKIPNELSEAIGDFRLVSAKTAEELCRLSKKGPEYLEILIVLAPKIRDGKYGHTLINREIEKKLNKKSNQEQHNKKVYSDDGRHLFTWRVDNNSVPSIHFPKDIVQLIDEEKISFDDLTEDIKQWLKNKLTELN